MSRQGAGGRQSAGEGQHGAWLRHAPWAKRWFCSSQSHSRSAACQSRRCAHLATPEGRTADGVRPKGCFHPCGDRRPPPPPHTPAPLGVLAAQVECCSPAALLSNGDLLQLQRCNCSSVDDKTCGGNVTHQLLWWVQGACPWE